MYNIVYYSDSNLRAPEGNLKVYSWDEVRETVKEKLTEGYNVKLINCENKKEHTIYKDTYLKESFDAAEESVKLNEDYASYIGKPLKDFLNTLENNTKLDVEYHSHIKGGEGGFSGRASQIPWYAADVTVEDIQLGDGKFYAFKIITGENRLEKPDIEEEPEEIDDNFILTDEEESTDEFNNQFGESLTEARTAGAVSEKPTYRYKVVVADENSNPLYLKDVAGIGKVNKQLELLTNDKLADMKATQVYVVREDDKEIYVKFVNDDGSWDIVQNDIDLENEVEDRDILFNHVMADLSSESSTIVGHLRNMSRKGEGYVGFDEEEIGFDNDTFYLTSLNDKQINWAKKVADFYGFQVSPVSERNGRKYIKIFAPGIGDDPKLVP